MKQLYSLAAVMHMPYVSRTVVIFFTLQWDEENTQRLDLCHNRGKDFAPYISVLSVLNSRPKTWLY